MAGIFSVPAGIFVLNWFCFKRQTQKSIGGVPYKYLGPLAIGTVAVSMVAWKGYTWLRGSPEPAEVANSDSAEMPKIHQRRTKLKKRAGERSPRKEKKARKDQAMTNYAIGGAVLILLLLVCCCLCGDDKHEDEWDIENPQPRRY